MRIRGDHEKSGNNALTAAILAELGRDPEGSVWTRYKEARQTVWSRQPSGGDLAASTVVGLRSCDGGFEFATIKE